MAEGTEVGPNGSLLVAPQAQPLRDWEADLKGERSYNLTGVGLLQAELSALGSRLAAIDESIATQERLAAGAHANIAAWKAEQARVLEASARLVATLSYLDAKP